MQKRQNKYEYLWIIQGRYGHHGWEDLSAYEGMFDARDDLRAYRENERGIPFRLIHRRELIQTQETIAEGV